MKTPLEWKKLSTSQKKDDKNISKFLRSIDDHGPNYIVSQVICNKHETTGTGMVDRTKFMNYLYGLMFKRISVFLKKTNSRAQLFIDRNTDTLAQESLRQYIASVSRYQTGQHPRHSKPKSHEFPRWDWKGLLYHPYACKDNYKHIFLPK